MFAGFACFLFRNKATVGLFVPIRDCHGASITTIDVLCCGCGACLFWKWGWGELGNNLSVPVRACQGGSITTVDVLCFLKGRGC